MQINYIFDLFIFLCVVFIRICKEIKVNVKVNYRYNVGIVLLFVIFFNLCRNKDVLVGVSMYDIRVYYDKFDLLKVC